eukprot:1156723-Pelagomonas_calceolata.AAC.2
MQADPATAAGRPRPVTQLKRGTGHRGSWRTYGNERADTHAVNEPGNEADRWYTCSACTLHNKTTADTGSSEAPAIF